MNTVAIDSVEMVRRLVGFDTTSRGSNLALIEFVRDYLDHYGVTSELVFDETGNKANLYATIGPAGVGGIMLSGHTDVVPVDGQDWHSDPFTVLAKDDRLFGRGTADMKSFIAVVLALLPSIAARPLRIPIHLAFSYDEEVGCRGARRLVAAIGRAAGPAASVRRRRADDDAAGDRAQGQAQLSLPGARVRVPLGLDPSRRQRDRGGGRDGRPAQGDGAAASASSARSTPTTRRPTRRSRPASSTAAPRSTSCPRNAASISSSGCCRATIPRPGSPSCAPSPRSGCCRTCARCAPEAAIAFEELSAFPGLDTPDDAEITRLVAVADRGQRHRQGQLRHRRRAVSAGRHRDRSSAARARSSRRTSPTNSSISTRSRSARNSSAGCSTGPQVEMSGRFVPCGAGVT